MLNENLKKKLNDLLKSEPSSPTTNESLAEKQVRWYNVSEGTLNQEDGINCPDCKNRGQYAFVDGEYLKFRECHCVELRRSVMRLKRSGISGEMLDKYTFKAFETNTQWQLEAKAKVKVFVVNNLNKPGQWLYIGGQSGAGKTHLCTAACLKLATKYSLRYETWSRIAAMIKSRALDPEEKDKLMYDLARPQVLYIDDLLKGTSKPTDADIKAMFDLINARYLDPKSITIISSELDLMQMLDIDEAIAGRIAERAGECAIALPKNAKLNYRLREN
jgi:DNA replication protein DnaC